MNYKKTYIPKEGYTPICKIGECSLKKLEFGIIELSPAKTLEFYTEDKETAFIMLEGHCNVEVNGEKWENIGNRMSVFENRKAESFYMPREQKLTIEAIDNIKIAVCATPVAEKTEPQVLREDHVTLKLLGRVPFQRETSFIIDGNPTQRCSPSVKHIPQRATGQASLPTSTTRTICPQNASLRKFTTSYSTPSRALRYSVCTRLTAKLTRLTELRTTSLLSSR